MKLISVVIPVFNRSGLIVRTLDSLAVQDLSTISIIVVDNGSTDGTPETVRRWAEAHRCSSLDLHLLEEPRKGASCARNRGLQAVRTPWVMFFDSDDEMLAGHLGRICSAIESNAGMDLIGFDTRSSHGKRFIFATDPWNLLFHGGMATQRWAARTAFVRRVGGWNEDISVWDDIELGTRLVVSGPKVIKLSGVPTVVIHESSDSLTARERSLDACAILSALRAMAQTMPELAPLIPFKLAIVAGINRRNNELAAEYLLQKAIIMRPQMERKLRIINRLARLRLPGITHITKKFIGYR